MRLDRPPSGRPSDIRSRVANPALAPLQVVASAEGGWAWRAKGLPMPEHRYSIPTIPN